MTAILASYFTHMRETNVPRRTALKVSHSEGGATTVEEAELTLDEDVSMVWFCSGRLLRKLRKIYVGPLDTHKW